ncbi:hypothetical protein [Anaerospora hongkongensis]|uniref:hypothetical protein n=1 Tax=Anaerospora hongkongensis TaxID=244830 RepID=UPI002FDB6FFF
MKKRGILLFQSTFFIILGIILLGASTLAFGQIKNVKIGQLKAESRIVDRALEAWAASHPQIKEDTVVFTQQGAVFEQKRTYPLLKADLMELQSKGFFPSTIDLSLYRYETKNDGADYSLEVVLPDGTLFKSPRSTY